MANKKSEAGLNCSFVRGSITHIIPEKKPASFARIAKGIASPYYKAMIEAIQTETDEKKRKELKSQLDYILPAGVFLKRNADSIIYYSGVVCMDVDGKDNPQRTVQEMRLTCLNDSRMHAFLLFYSPTHTGIKVFLHYDTKKYTYRESFNAYWMYFKKALHINVDYCADVPRACFMSYDPVVMYNEKEPFSGIPIEEWSKTFDMESDSKKRQTPPSTTYKPDKTSKSDKKEQQADTETLDHVMTVLGRISKKGVDIAPTYDDYYRLGKSLANLGDNGLPVFLKCCSFNKDHKRTDPAKDFRKYVADPHREVGIATYFNLAKNAGVDVSKPLSDKPTIGDRIMEIEDPMRLPLFSDRVFCNLPPLLKLITDNYKERVQKCLMLLSSIGTISSVLPNLNINYDGVLIEPNLFIFFIGTSGSGKGKVQCSLHLVQPIHDKIEEDSKQEYFDYIVQLNKLKNAKGKAEEAEKLAAKPVPPVKLFHLPGNITAAYIVRMLAMNGGRGLIFETESDTLANMLSKDYGDFSDLLRKIPHHEEYTMARQGEEKSENYTIKHPCVSVVLTGTPNQLPNLIHNTQDGLFGRFCYWYVAQPPMWRNPYAHQDEEPDYTLFDKLAKDIYVTYTKLKCVGDKGVKFKFTGSQIEKLNDEFLGMYIKNYKLYEGQFDGVMFRLGISHARLAMVLTALRQPGVDSFDNDLVCSDIDFEVSLEMIKTMEQHSTYAFRRLNNENDERMSIINTKSKKYLFLNLLPEIFSRHIAIEIGKGINLSRASIYRYLQDFLKDKNGKGRFLVKIDEDVYRKTANCHQK